MEYWNSIVVRTDNVHIPAIWVEAKYISDAIELIHCKELEFQNF